MLVIVGLMLLTGWWNLAIQWLQVHLAGGFEPSI